MALATETQAEGAERKWPKSEFGRIQTEIDEISLKGTAIAFEDREKLLELRQQRKTLGETAERAGIFGVVDREIDNAIRFCSEQNNFEYAMRLYFKDDCDPRQVEERLISGRLAWQFDKEKWAGIVEFYVRRAGEKAVYENDKLGDATVATPEGEDYFAREEWEYEVGLAKFAAGTAGTTGAARARATGTARGRSGAIPEAEEGGLTERQALVIARDVVRGYEAIGKSSDQLLWEKDASMKSAFDKLSDREAERRILSEVTARRQVLELVSQWQANSSGEKKLGGLKDEARVSLEVGTLQMLSGLPPIAEKDEFGNESEVSLSHQVSRAVFVYKFLVKWAEAEASPDARDDLIAEAQRWLGGLRDNDMTSEGAALFVGTDGKVEARLVRQFLDSFPGELRRYENWKTLNAALESGVARIDVVDLFGRTKNPFTAKGLTENDLNWSKEVVAFFSGSKDAEAIARSLFIFTGEAARANVLGVEVAVDASGGAKKLFHMELYRMQERARERRTGSEYTVGKYPRAEIPSWFRKAEVASVAREGQKRGVWEEMDEVAFHKIDWGNLPPGTYGDDHLKTLDKCLTVFNAVTESPDGQDLKVLSDEGLLGKLSGAFKVIYGGKDNYRARPETSPWVVFTVGMLERIRPNGRPLPGIPAGAYSEFRRENKAFRMSQSTRMEAGGNKLPGFKEDVAMRLIRIRFLENWELQAVCRILGVPVPRF